MRWSSIFTPKVLKILFGMYLILFPTTLIWFTLAFDFEPSEYVLRELILLASVMIFVFFIYTIYKWVKKRNEQYTRGAVGIKGDVGPRVSNYATMVDRNKTIGEDTDDNAFGITTTDLTQEDITDYQNKYFDPWKITIKKAVTTIFINGRDILNNARNLISELGATPTQNTLDNLTTFVEMLNKLQYSNSYLKGNSLPSSVANLNVNTVKTKYKLGFEEIRNTIQSISKGDIKKALKKYLRAKFQDIVMNNSVVPKSNNETQTYDEIDIAVDKLNQTKKIEFLDEVFSSLNNTISTIDSTSIFAIDSILKLNTTDEVLQEI